jgi:hypothetical protein
VSLVPIIAWIAAVALAAVVLSFCGYEVWWKARRFQRDLARLDALRERAELVQSQVADIQARTAQVLRTATG